MSSSTQTRRSTRTRPRAHALAPVVNSSSSPVPAKRKRLRHEPSRDQVFAIKDIVDEKFVNGARWFKIDWADDPTTGQAFEPTWEPEENANQEAVDDWEWEKNRRHLIGLSKPSPTPSRSPSRSPPPSSQQDVSGHESASTHAHLSRSAAPSTIYIELQTKLDFLRSRPDIDPAQILTFTSSQLSQFPHPDSERRLPPSQFLVTSSQPSQDAVLADTQSFSTVSTQSQVAAPFVRAQAISQTTIPDSQDYSTDFSQEPVEVPCTLDDINRPEIASAKTSHHTTSASSIPSRQPDGNLVSFGTFSLSTYPDQNRGSQENFAELQPITVSPPPSSLESSRVPCSGFLTQLEFDPGEFSLSAKSHQDSQTNDSAARPGVFASHSTVQDTAALEDSHQPAQRVLPFHQEESRFLAQDEPDFLASEEYDLVPPASSRTSGPLEQPLVPSQGTVTPATRNCGTRHPPIQNAVIPFTESKGLVMDEAEPVVPERSALEELRAIQLHFLAKTAEDPSEGLADHNAASGRGHNIPPTPVSPSDIISSVEQDGLDALDNPQIPAVAGTESWVQAPDPMLFTGPLGSHHAPAVTVESSTASLAAATPASGAIGHAADVEMAFAAAALNTGLEPSVGTSDRVPATITPSELLAPSASTAIPGSSLNPDQELGTNIAGPELHDTVMQDDDEFGILPSEETAANEYIIPLPPPARNRATAYDMTNKTYREDVENFKMLLAQNPSVSPDHKAVARIDMMLQSLTEMSNLPAYHNDFSGLSEESWARYARDSCSKLAFLYEFLDTFRNVDVEVAILADAGPIMNKVEAIASQGNFTRRRLNDQGWVQAPSGKGSACKVIMVDTSQRGLTSRLTANILIAYDETAETSGMLQPYKSNRPEDQMPLIFSLLEVYSIEHINRRLSPNMRGLERKLAQVRCLELLSLYADDESAYECVPMPHEIVLELFKYLVDEDGFQPIESRWNTWQHQHIPEDVFDGYKAMRAQMAAYESRKRARRDSDSGADTPKRARLASSDEIQLSEGMKARFGDDIRVKDGRAQVSIEKLEDLIGLVKDLKAQLDKKGEQVQGYAKFIRRFQPKYQEAIGDRGKFELERDRAIKEKDKIQKELERTKTQVTKLSEDNKDLASKLQEIARMKDPELAATAQATAAQREVEYRTAIEKSAKNERQIATIRADLDFAQSRYQDASDKAAELGEENKELKLQVRGLETRASDNVVEIRKINAQRTDARLRQMYDQEKAMRQAHEREIDRIKEELRTCKARFGGRETRGSSVPRSPRPSRQMSSRNTSPVGDGSNSGSGTGNSGGNGNGGGAMASVFGPRPHLRDL